MNLFENYCETMLELLETFGIDFNTGHKCNHKLVEKQTDQRLLEDYCETT